jgi:hypothetical protein
VSCSAASWSWGNQVLQRELPEVHDVTDSALPLRERVASARCHSIACSAAARAPERLAVAAVTFGNGQPIAGCVVI